MSENLTLPTTRYQRVVSLLSLLLLAGTLLYLLFKWPYIPDTVPKHYGIDGAADAYGGKSSLFVVPVMDTLIFLLTTLISRFPQAWNVPVAVTHKNRDWVYRNTKNMLYTLRLCVTLMFFYMNYQSINCKNINNLLVIFILAAMFGSMIFFCIRCKKVPPSQEEPKEFDGF